MVGGIQKEQLSIDEVYGYAQKRSAAPADNAATCAGRAPSTGRFAEFLNI
jgi:hypothetical protein